MYERVGSFEFVFIALLTQRERSLPTFTAMTTTVSSHETFEKRGNSMKLEGMISHWLLEGAVNLFIESKLGTSESLNITDR